MPAQNKVDSRLPYYVVYKKNPNGSIQFAGYAPMGGANVSDVDQNLIITDTVMLSKFAAKTARRAGLIYEK